MEDATGASSEKENGHLRRGRMWEGDIQLCPGGTGSVCLHVSTRKPGNGAMVTSKHKDTTLQVNTVNTEPQEIFRNMGGFFFFSFFEEAGRLLQERL